MAYKTLIFGTDDLYPRLKPFYINAIKNGILKIVGYAVLENDKIRLVNSAGNVDSSKFDLAIISSANDFYNRMKILEAHGFGRNKIIDGRVFKVPHLDFPRLLKEGVACGVFDNNVFDAGSHMVYPQFYKTKDEKITLSLGTKSYICKNSSLQGRGSIILGNFDYFSTGLTFRLGENYSHNYLNVGMVSIAGLDWKFPREFLPPQGMCKILVGNDAWCGRGCVFNSNNPNKPLVIGDGAVIASNSVVVKNVPPYAIVGGNPAKIIKYRFSEDVIESLLRIKWWDWSLDKIYDNFKYFNDIEKFISLHDK